MNKKAEADFFDHAYDTNARRKIGQAYSITQSRLQYYEKRIFDDVKGKRVFEYGCGTGSYSFRLTQAGAQVVGIDISEIGIQNARKQATELGLSNVEFLLMDAEKMEFPDADFDRVFGSGILHHLELEVALGDGIAASAQAGG